MKPKGAQKRKKDDDDDDDVDYVPDKLEPGKGKRVLRKRSVKGQVEIPQEEEFDGLGKPAKKKPKTKSHDSSNLENQQLDEDTDEPIISNLQIDGRHVLENARVINGEVPNGLKMSYFRGIPVQPLNVISLMQKYAFGFPGNQHQFLNILRKQTIVREINTFSTGGVTLKFGHRMTALEWHPTQPYLLAAADKWGDIALAKPVNKNLDSAFKFEANRIIEGTGPGGAIFSLKFDPNRPSILFVASLDGNFVRYDVNNLANRLVYHTTEDPHTHWYTAMDVSHYHKTILGCTSKGYARLHHIDGHELLSVRMHSTKIHHCEFNQKVEYLLTTASLQNDRQVCLWDIRNLKDNRPLHILPHRKGANVARFNYSGSRLLTNDQRDEIKVFDAPLWNESCVIVHPHRQFQQLTAIEASWHSLHDLIVIGRYPEADEKPMPGSKVAPRPIQIFDPDKPRGDQLVAELLYPENGIVSLNQFNRTGEVLASGMGLNLLLWQPDRSIERLYGEKKKSSKPNLSKAMRSTFRGHGDESDSDDSDDDSGHGKKDKKRKKMQVDRDLSNRKKTASKKASSSRGGKK